MLHWSLTLPTDVANLSAQEILAWALRTHGKRFALVTSFQAEGMALVDIAARLDNSVRVVTLDTGRLPEQTFGMMEAVRERYGLTVEVVFPDAAEVEQMTARHGVNLFYNDLALRRLCCHVRKTRPLDRKLADFDCWAAGLRRAQSAERSSIEKAEIQGGRIKLHPLADWTDQQLQEYLSRHEVPHHPLYARGYSSIGCAPCTRAIQAGEDSRAGRWWWEQDASKECGIHVSPEGKVQRTLDVLLDELLIH